jgi:hypothetical protein
MEKIIRFLEFFWKRPLVSVAMFLAAALIVILSGFWLVKKGSVVDYPRNLNSRNVMAERDVRASAINLANPSLLYIRCYPRITKDHLLILDQFQRKAEKYFTDKGLGNKVFIASLASIVDYHSSDLSNFITDKKLSDRSFDAEAWTEKIIPRIEVEGSLAGKIPGEYEYLLVTIFPNEDLPEFELSRLIRDFFKEGHLSVWEKMLRFALNADELTIWEIYLFPELKINPLFFEVNGKKVDITYELFSWQDGRLEIDARSNFETWGRVFGGICLFSLFFLLIFLLTRQAIVSVAIIVIAFLANRSLIGIFDLVTIYFYHGDYRYVEDVFSILNSPPSLIAGFSYPLRSFYKFNDEVCERFDLKNSQGEMGNQEYWKCWRKSFSLVFFALTLIVSISVQDYLVSLGIQQYNGARPMWQVAVFSSTGLILSYLLTVIFMPPFYRLIGGKKLAPYQKRFVFAKSGTWGKISQFADRIVSTITGFFLRRAAARPPYFQIAIVGAVFTAAIIMLANGKLITDSKPEELLYSLPMGETAKELQKPGRPGFNFSQTSFYGEMDNAETLDSIWKYCQETKKAGRTMSGPMNFFVSILLRDVPQYRLGGSIKEAIRQFVSLDFDDPSEAEIEKASRKLIRDIWHDLMSRKSTALLMKSFLAKNNPKSFYPDQMNMYFTYAGTKASSMADFIDRCYERAAKYLLEVKIPDKLALYAELDEQISLGLFGVKPPWGILLTDLVSIFMLFSVFFLVFVCQNRKSQDVKVRPLVGASLVALPFAFSSMVILLVMMIRHIPYDVASASIKSITVAVGSDLPSFLIFGFVAILRKAKAADFEKIMLGAEMRREANECFLDFIVNSSAFIFLVLVSLATIHRVGLMLELSMCVLFLSTIWMITPFFRYLFAPVQEQSLAAEPVLLADKN